jgi:hypothetical protein
VMRQYKQERGAQVLPRYETWESLQDARQWRKGSPTAHTYKIIDPSDNVYPDHV